MAGGYHLFSSGEVLTAANANNYLMNQTVMVFASAAARTSALAGVLAEGMTSYRTDSHVFEVYNGTTWVASETNLTTKGDIAVYDTAPNRLAVGTDGQILMANSGSTPGLAWVGYSPAGKNAIINGGMDIWQRGTSFTGASPYYCADRWTGSRGGATAGGTWSRQVTADTTNLPNIQYCIRISRAVGNTSVAVMETNQSLETANSIPFAGKTVTMSYYARKGATYSGGGLTASIITGTGTDENELFGYTGSAISVSTSATLTTTWQRFTISGTIAVTATEMAVDFVWTPTGTAGATDYVDITGVQLELGSTATTFSRAGGSIGGELQLCRRYLPATYVNEIMGYSYATNNTVYGIAFDTPARVAPTGVTASGTFTAYSLNVGTSATPVLNQTSVNNGSVLVNSGITIIAGQGSRLGGGGLILWTGCEL